MTNRNIIIHFHFFKNAGTSIESILRKNLQDRFLTHELGSATDSFPASDLLPLLEKNQDIAAVSSHTIFFPAPEHPQMNIFPIVFLRHPLDRILSMYNFELKQKTGQAEAQLTDETGLVEYIQARRVNPASFRLRNYQMWMLARKRAPARDKQALFEVAKQQIESLPVVGVVEDFSESVRQLTQWLEPHFPGLDMQPEHENRSSAAHLNIEQRLDLLRDTVGSDLYEELESENALDTELHNIAVRQLAENRSK